MTLHESPSCSSSQRATGLRRVNPHPSQNAGPTLPSFAPLCPATTCPDPSGGGGGLLGPPSQLRPSWGRDGVNSMSRWFRLGAIPFDVTRGTTPPRWGHQPVAASLGSRLGHLWATPSVGGRDTSRGGGVHAASPRRRRRPQLVPSRSFGNREAEASPRPAFRPRP